MHSLHSLGDDLATFSQTRINVVKNRNTWPILAKYRYEIYYLPQILRVYGYHLPTLFFKKWSHEPWEMLANIPIPWSILVLYLSSIYTWSLKQPFINGCLVKQPFST